LLLKKLAIAIFTAIRNNEVMTTFDDIEFRRPGIAQVYLAQPESMHRLPQSRQISGSQH